MKKDHVEVPLKYGTRADGYEYPDPRPVEVPTRLKLPQRQVDRVREVIRRELSMAAQDEGYESFDEADDFELPDEDPVSPYEELFEPPVVESRVPQSAATQEKNDGDRVEVDGERKAVDRVGARSGDKGARKADGKADSVAGSSDSAGRAGKGDKGSSE